MTPSRSQPSTTDLLKEIERLQEAKKRALAIADERAKEANELRSQLAKAHKALELAIEELGWGEFDQATRRLKAALKDIPK